MSNSCIHNACKLWSGIFYWCTSESDVYTYTDSWPSSVPLTPGSAPPGPTLMKPLSTARGWKSSPAFPSRRRPAPPTPGRLRSEVGSHLRASHGRAEPRGSTIDSCSCFTAEEANAARRFWSPASAVHSSPSSWRAVAGRLRFDLWPRPSRLLGFPRWAQNGSKGF